MHQGTAHRVRRARRHPSKTIFPKRGVGLDSDRPRSRLGVPSGRTQKRERGEFKLSPSEDRCGVSYTNSIQSGVTVERYEPLIAKMDDIFVNLVSEGGAHR